MTGSDLITLYGETDGVATTGVFTLTSDVFYAGVSHIRLDKNIVAKVWSIEVSLNPVTVDIEYTHDVTAPTPAWTKAKSIHLATAGEVAHDKRRPIRTITARTGREGIRFSWQQVSPAKSHIAIIVEFVEAGSET